MRSDRNNVCASGLGAKHPTRQAVVESRLAGLASLALSRLIRLLCTDWNQQKTFKLEKSVVARLLSPTYELQVKNMYLYDQRPAQDRGHRRECNSNDKRLGIFSFDRPQQLRQVVPFENTNPRMGRIPPHTLARLDTRTSIYLVTTHRPEIANNKGGSNSLLNGRENNKTLITRH